MAAGYGYFKWLMNQASFVSTMTLVSLSLLVLLVNVGLTTAAEQSSSRKLGVTPLSACKVQLDDGRIVDLSSLDDASNPKYFKLYFSLRNLNILFEFYLFFIK